jgi:hypothetical protein
MLRVSALSHSQSVSKAAGAETGKKASLTTDFKEESKVTERFS